MKPKCTQYGSEDIITGITVVDKNETNRKDHPLFKPFLKTNSHLKYLNKKDQAKHFAKWLRDNKTETDQ